MSGPRVAVVGAGVIGASIAYHLAREGAAVTLIDEGRPARRATNGSFAWINAHSNYEEPYFDLRMHAMGLWHGLAAEIPGLPVRFGGGVTWDGTPDEIEAQHDRFAERDYPARLLSRRKIAEVEPALSAPPDVALAADAEGVADPRRIAGCLADAARNLGAQVQAGVEVLGVQTESGRATGVETTAGLIGADHVVLAAGIATEALLAALDVALPMDNKPGVLIRTEPVRPLSHRILCSPGAHLWQLGDGSMIAGEDFSGLKQGENIGTLIETLRARIEQLFGEPGPASVAEHTVAVRPMPKDDRPVVGPVTGIEGLSVAVMHSGVTLAPAIGAGLARAVLDDALPAMLERYRLDRFAAT